MLVPPKQKTRERDGPTRVGNSENKEMLPGGESPPAGRSCTVSEETGRCETLDDEGRSRKKYRHSGPFAQEREADPQPGETRVRFEFARRAHQRKITPKLGINLVARGCQGERGDSGEKSCDGWRAMDIGDQISERSDQRPADQKRQEFTAEVTEGRRGRGEEGPKSTARNGCTTKGKRNSGKGPTFKRREWGTRGKFKGKPKMEA
jgi:hypothetical protein